MAALVSERVIASYLCGTRAADDRTPQRKANAPTGQRPDWTTPRLDNDPIQTCPRRIPSREEGLTSANAEHRTQPASS